jgi:hypothetical protein
MCCRMASALELGRQLLRRKGQRDRLEDAGETGIATLKHSGWRTPRNCQIALYVGVEKGNVRKWWERLSTEIPQIARRRVRRPVPPSESKTKREPCGQQSSVRLRKFRSRTELGTPPR